MNAEFAKDFINAQSEILTLPKDKKGYGYNYTDFDTVVKTVKPILKKNHLGFCQLLDSKENGKNGITTILFHESGESFQSWFELPAVVLGKANNAQNIGAAISYIKRYALCAILGCSSDDDTDGMTESQQAQAQAQKQQYQQRPVQNQYQYPQQYQQR
ncbi:MAG: ERF family protein [Treponema sp.]|nr:ERF family protein [Treponema sp.]